MNYKTLFETQKLLMGRAGLVGDKYAPKFLRDIDAAIERAWNEAETQRKIDNAALLASMRAGKAA